jgi:hypothetical protein
MRWYTIDVDGFHPVRIDLLRTSTIELLLEKQDQCIGDPDEKFKLLEQLRIELVARKIEGRL